ncbi:DNA-binding transcriptional regulator [Rouxiella badensis]|uniref:DNA-binding transcriptional regulator n=1 Tax=Rouxiella badensis TaxID=1646377 RepID=UPI001D1367B9|nr:DNA-binding transcriptional regulator [Rouxiella badensis]MCC3704183.1 DNA-binding transcriptional regulator [Rouxiella badensis]
MMHCPKCQHSAHARTSRYLSPTTKERYHQCQNINCSCTFKSLETIEDIIVAPGEVKPVPPHPSRMNQGLLWI